MRTAEPMFTSSDYEQLPEGFPAQLVEGDFVKEPAPRYGHQLATGRLYRRLCEIAGDERVVLAPLDVYLDEHNVYQPDVAVFAEPPPTQRWRDAGIPLLAVEVLSPSTAALDRKPKLQHYLERGVREVWIVDPRTGTIDVHTAAGVRSHGPDDAAASAVVPGFTVTGRSLLRAAPRRG